MLHRTLFFSTLQLINDLGSTQIQDIRLAIFIHVIWGICKMKFFQKFYDPIHTLSIKNLIIAGVVVRNLSTKVMDNNINEFVVLF